MHHIASRGVNLILPFCHTAVRRMLGAVKLNILFATGSVRVRSKLCSDIHVAQPEMPIQMQNAMGIDAFY